MTFFVQQSECFQGVLSKIPISVQKKTTAMFRPPPPCVFTVPPRTPWNANLFFSAPKDTCGSRSSVFWNQEPAWRSHVEISTKLTIGFSLNKGLIKGTWFLGGGGNWGSPLRLPWWLKNNRWHRCLHIGLFLDPLLIYLLVSVSSILTLRYICWFPLNDVCDIYVLESGKWCKRHVWICFLALKKNISLASRAHPKQDVC